MSLKSNIGRIMDLMNLNEGEAGFKRRVPNEVIEGYFQTYLDQALVDLPKFEDLSDWQIKGLIDSIIWNIVFSLMNSFIGITEHIDMFSLFERLKSLYRNRIMDQFRAERYVVDEQSKDTSLLESTYLKRRFNFDREYLGKEIDFMVDAIINDLDVDRVEIDFDFFCDFVLLKVVNLLETNSDIILNFSEENNLVIILKEMFHDKLVDWYKTIMKINNRSSLTENLSRITKLMGISENVSFKRRFPLDKINEFLNFYLEYKLNDLNYYIWENYPEIPVEDMERFTKKVINYVTLGVTNESIDFFIDHPEMKDEIKNLLTTTFQDKIQNAFIEKIKSNHNKHLGE